MRCPIFTNHNTRNDGRCVRYYKCQTQGLAENIEKLLDRVKTPVNWDGQEWKTCPATAGVLR